MKYRTAVIDPPWPYDRVTANPKLSGFVGQDGDTHYDTMTIERLKQLPIRDLVDGYVFLWTTGPFIPDAVDLVRAWGLNYRAMMYWLKTTTTGKIAYGPGYWVRSCIEPIIIATTQGTPAVRTNERAVVSNLRLSHSEKPEVFQDIIEKHFPGPYLELFARRHRPGWRCMGLELSGLDIEEEMKNEG